MTADTITLPREEVFEAAAWLLAFEQLFEEIEELTPSSLFDDAAKPEFSPGLVVMGFARELAGGSFPDDDEGFESDETLVELHARARELAARMVANHEREAGDRGIFAFSGDSFTSLGLRHLAERLAAGAVLTRHQGVMNPRVPAGA